MPIGRRRWAKNIYLDGSRLFSTTKIFLTPALILFVCRRLPANEINDYLCVLCASAVTNLFRFIPVIDKHIDAALFHMPAILFHQLFDQLEARDLADQAAPGRLGPGVLEAGRWRGRCVGHGNRKRRNAPIESRFPLTES